MSSVSIDHGKFKMLSH